MLKVEIIGNIGADAKIVNGANGAGYLMFSVAHNPRKEGAQPVWINCSHRISGGGNLSQYLLKGTRVYVRGNLSVSVYTTDDGEIVPNIACQVSELELLGR